MLTKKAVYLRSRRFGFGRDGNPALKCEPNGYIRANTWGKALGWEKWTLHYVQNENDQTRIALQSWTGIFLSAKPDGLVQASDKLGSWEMWEVCPSSGNFVSLKSHHGQYLCCDNLMNCGQYVRADRDTVQEWEEWMILDDPNAFTDPGYTARAALSGTLIGVGALVCLTDVAIPSAGFGIRGVATASVAAGVQSAIYGGATSSGVFSVLQSVGATLVWVPVAVGGGYALAAGVIMND